MECSVRSLILCNALLTICNSLDAITRLFRIILDVTSEAVVVKDKKWRSSLMPVFYRFFSCIWAEEKVDRLCLK